MLQVSFPGIIVAAGSSMLISYLWYGPVMGAEWMKLTRRSEEDINAVKQKGMYKVFLISLILTVVLAYFTGLLVKAMGANTIFAGAQTGFFIWVGFIVPTHLVHFIYEKRPLGLFKITAVHHLLELLVMGSVLALIG